MTKPHPMLLVQSALDQLTEAYRQVKDDPSIGTAAAMAVNAAGALAMRLEFSAECAAVAPGPIKRPIRPGRIEGV